MLRSNKQSQQYFFKLICLPVSRAETWWFQAWSHHTKITYLWSREYDAGVLTKLVTWVQSQLAYWIFLICYGRSRGDAASKQIKITHFIVYLRMKQINSSGLTDGLIKLKSKKQSQHDIHEANNFYCWFSPNEVNGEKYWTFNTSEFPLISNTFRSKKKYPVEIKGRTAT